MESQNYIERDVLVELFTDERTRSALSELAFGLEEHGTIPPETDFEEGVKDLFIEIGFFFEDDDGIVLNEYHELTKILSKPHIPRLLSNEVAIGVLSVFLRKAYVPCISIESLTELTPYSEEEIEDSLELLDKLRLTKRTMVGEGKEARYNVVKDSAEVLERIDSLIDLLDEEESVSVDELEDAIGDIDDADHDEPRVVAMSEEELTTQLKEAALFGAEEIQTTDSMLTIEAGTHGWELNTSSELAKLFGRLHLVLLRYVEEIHDFYYDRNQT